jgi:hypothetical protein
VDARSIPEPLRRDLLRYLAATSKERARLIGELVERNQAMAELLMNLEDDVGEIVRIRLVDALRREVGGQ